MTPAQRVAQSRQRSREAALVAGEDVSRAPTVALLANLARQIKFIENDPEHAPVARDIARLVIDELRNRYEIAK